MLKNNYLKNSDIIGTSNYTDATGNISEGYTIILKEIEFAGFKMYNIRASVVKNLDAPLLLGQSAISKLGKIQLDLVANTLTILNGVSNYDYSSDSQIKKNEINKQFIVNNYKPIFQSKEVDDLWEERQAEMKKDGTFLRVKADETSQVISWIPKNSKITLNETLGSFCNVSFENKTGYITSSAYKKLFPDK